MNVDNRIANLTQQPQSVRLMFCSACRIATNHHRTESGLWVCWCGNVDESQNTSQAVREMAERRDAILQAIEEKQVQPNIELMRELAELNTALEGNDIQDGVQ